MQFTHPPHTTDWYDSLHAANCPWVTNLHQYMGNMPSRLYRLSEANAPEFNERNLQYYEKQCLYQIHICRYTISIYTDGKG